MELTERSYDNLPVHVYETREELGRAAAADAAKRINAAIARNGTANVVFAAAPSQNELLENLARSDVDWSKVRAFHQDEYIGIEATDSAGFGNFLRRAIFDRLNFKELYFMNCGESDVEDNCEGYAALLKKYPADLILLGVGENGHLAFNDPPVADFDDPKMLKIVDLDEICRQQQVNDGCFMSIEDVPKQAMTMTLSCIMNIPEAICVVPTTRKARAVGKALCGPVTTDCPASILRKHPNAALYLDKDSASAIL